MRRLLPVCGTLISDWLELLHKTSLLPICSTISPNCWILDCHEAQFLKFWSLLRGWIAIWHDCGNPDLRWGVELPCGTIMKISAEESNCHVAWLWKSWSPLRRWTAMKHGYENPDLRWGVNLPCGTIIKILISAEETNCRRATLQKSEILPSRLTAMWQ